MSHEETPSSDLPEPAPPPPAPSRWNRDRAARWVALVGLLAVVLGARTMVVPSIPQARDVEVLLPSPGDVTGLEMRWSAEGTSDDITTTSFHFSAGSAPPSARAIVRLPDGAYQVAISVERVAGVTSTSRRVTLSDATYVTIPLQ